MSQSDFLTLCFAVTLRVTFILCSVCARAVLFVTQYSSLLDSRRFLILSKPLHAGRLEPKLFEPLVSQASIVSPASLALGFLLAPPGGR